MTTVERPRYNVIGTRPIRPDGVEKVTGRAQYGADIRPAGLLHGALLRSPHAHARILSIDTSGARSMPGVLAVMTAADLPVPASPNGVMGIMPVSLPQLNDQALASTKVLYTGQAVAAVAAVNRHVAEEACKKIVVEYEVLPPVLEVRAAMRPGAPLLDETRVAKGAGIDVSDQPSNIATATRMENGDVDKAFAEADHVYEREFSTTMVHQGYLELHNATAAWTSDGTVTIWTSTQAPFWARAQVALQVGLPLAKVKVIPLEIGGGFGGKIVGYFDAVAALLAKETGRPVKMVMDRAAVFSASGPTSGSSMKVAVAEKGGRLTGLKADLAFEAGAYPGSPVGGAAGMMIAPYDIQDFRIDAYDVVVNKPKTAAYRAPGAPISAFAMEQCIDELARMSGNDPLELRMRSSTKEGTRTSAGTKSPLVGHEECLQAALTSAHYKSPIEGPHRGRGVASGAWGNAGLQSSVTIAVNQDGSVNLMEGSTDIGGSRASLAMQLAETLGVSYETIKPVVVDTDSVGYTDVTGGSRTTHATGMAVVKGGEMIIEDATARGAKMLKLNRDEVEYRAGSVHSTKDDRALSLKEIAAGAMATGGPMTASASVNAGGVGPAYATHIVDVDVDPETGKVTILRYTAIQDVGTAIHPSYVEGQIQGGVAQGIGWALNEEYYYNDDGTLANASYLDYRMPTAFDVPMIDTILVEVPNPGHPFGVRGVGEVPIVPPLAAIANAINDALGVRFTDLPMSPRRISEALR